MNIYKCDLCGIVVEEIKHGVGHPSCCDKLMILVKAGTTDGDAEKHVPVVTVNDREVTVKIGEVDHPMTEDHYIEWIEIETTCGMQRKRLKPGNPPMAMFALAKDEEFIAAYAYCNVHGLWKSK